MLTPQQIEHYRTQPEIAAALRQYSEAFCRSVLTVLYLEGGLKDDGGLNNIASDRGGLTKFGISQNAYPRINIEALEIHQAIRLYYRDYWEPMQCDELNPGAALILFDGAVQHGVDAMTRIAQKAAGAKVDGLNGPRTLKACLGVLPPEFITLLLSSRSYRYARIAVDDTSQIANLRGWYNRISHIAQCCYQEVSHG
ncbi:hypothetical protein N473_07005 [Pseudoalteromonas luteoviolacea CPMOR-1]|uniref:Uncharacterized protein n=1 Tax=Pseudoalteromonas luteoviolacea CPMOR-1 TaxID=1365248 RepID=A0A167H4A7_9GAMM|nr:glycosyl hydrolase 108 family protein [Pseudoalteromonas luteoviolacea]KZN57617.1 hypothetical protein N473_07005 [Pseudoalteromonas luteoviolacea CPMOR-1]